MRKFFAYDLCPAEWIIIRYTGITNFHHGLKDRVFKVNKPLGPWLSMGMKEFNMWTNSYEQGRMTQKTEPKHWQEHLRTKKIFLRIGTGPHLRNGKGCWWCIWHFLHAHEYERIHVLMHMYGGQRTTANVIPQSDHSPYSIETKFLMRTLGLTI